MIMNLNYRESGLLLRPQPEAAAAGHRDQATVTATVTEWASGPGGYHHHDDHRVISDWLQCRTEDDEHS